MIPRSPLGASRPLCPVIGRGGGRTLRRPPLTLLWRRRPPRPIVPHARATPLHLHSHWNLHVRLLWSLPATILHHAAPNPAPEPRRRARRVGNPGPHGRFAHGRPLAMGQPRRRAAWTLWRRFSSGEAPALRSSIMRRFRRFADPEGRSPRPSALPTPPRAPIAQGTARSGRPALEELRPPAEARRGGASLTRATGRAHALVSARTARTRTQRFRSHWGESTEVERALKMEFRREHAPHALRSTTLEGWPAAAATNEQRLPISNQPRWAKAPSLLSRERWALPAGASAANAPRTSGPGPVIPQRSNARFPTATASATGVGERPVKARQLDSPSTRSMTRERLPAPADRPVRPPRFALPWEERPVRMAAGAARGSVMRRLYMAARSRSRGPSIFADPDVWVPACSTGSLRRAPPIARPRRRSGNPPMPGDPLAAARSRSPIRLPQGGAAHRRSADALPRARRSISALGRDSAARLRQLLGREEAPVDRQFPESSISHAPLPARRKAFAPPTSLIRAQSDPPAAADQRVLRQPRRSGPVFAISGRASVEDRAQFVRPARGTAQSVVRYAPAPILAATPRPGAARGPTDIVFPATLAGLVRRSTARFGDALANRRPAILAFAAAAPSWASREGELAAMQRRRKRRTAASVAPTAHPHVGGPVAAGQRRSAIRPPIMQPTDRRTRLSGSWPRNSPEARGKSLSKSRPQVRLVRAAAPAREAPRRVPRPVDLLWPQGGTSTSTTIVQGGFEPVAAAEPVRLGPQELPHRPPAVPPPDINRLVDEVISRLDRQARTERLRRGL